MSAWSWSTETNRRGQSYLVLFEETKFLTASELASLAMRAALY